MLCFAPTLSASCMQVIPVPKEKASEVASAFQSAASAQNFTFNTIPPGMCICVVLSS